MLSIIVSPNIPKTTLYEIALQMGVAWYLPIVYGCLAILIAAIVCWLISKNWCKYLAYCGGLICFLFAAVHWSMLGNMYDLGHLTGSGTGLMVLCLQIDAWLLAIALVVLHLRVCWGWFES